MSDIISNIVVQKNVNGEWQDSTEFTDGDKVRIKIIYGADSGKYPSGAVLTFKINGAGTNLTGLSLPEGTAAMCLCPEE